ncbi:sensor histidine kinase [Reichenbachiella agarivorans]|uniref:histidine kinase n=1 Tax=Reichenbachiella agarivorans TaxID=2979464 RepID=A0ABY6CP72_9BACT|nr:sensor histidine kinase [Reichenbachiella agarivorans]UXP32327.1 sensor histidine kinase [Reichenbachiella agarivorans]
MSLNKGMEEKQGLLLSIMEGVPYGIIAMDMRGKITLTNALALDFLDISARTGELLDTEVLHLCRELPDLKRKIEFCLDVGLEDFDLEEIHFHEKYLTFRGRRVQEGMVITIADFTSITASKHIALSSLLEGQELERKRLAREIHDGIGPTLSTVKMKLANIEGDLESINHELAEKFRQSYEMIDEAADDLRSISHNLMPRVLSDFGLVEALDTLCDKIDETKSVTVDYLNSGLESRLDEVTELGLYRISQELINNTLKYAHAKKITLQLIKREEGIRLLYEDDGRGFDPNEISHGLGFMNIENRTKALAGQVTIDSHPDKGMTALIEIPLS